MRRTPHRRLLVALLASAFAMLSTAAVAAAHVHHDKRGRSQASSSQFTARVFVQGTTITHPLGDRTERVSNPDDITRLGDRIFVAFQNGVGPQGEASPEREPRQHDRRVQSIPARSWPSGTSSASATA